jgi:hypothetical protein
MVLNAPFSFILFSILRKPENLAGLENLTASRAAIPTYTAKQRVTVSEPTVSGEAPALVAGSR